MKTKHWQAFRMFRWTVCGASTNDATTVIAKSRDGVTCAGCREALDEAEKFATLAMLSKAVRS